MPRAVREELSLHPQHAHDSAGTLAGGHRLHQFAGFLDGMHTISIAVKFKSPMACCPELNNRFLGVGQAGI